MIRIPEMQQLEKAVFPERQPTADAIQLGRPDKGMTMAFSRSWIDVKADTLAKTFLQYESATRPREFREAVRAFCRWMDFFVEEARLGVDLAKETQADGYRDSKYEAADAEDAKAINQANARLEKGVKEAMATYRGKVRKASAKYKALRQIIATRDIVEEFEEKLKADLDRVAKGV